MSEETQLDRIERKLDLLLAVTPSRSRPRECSIEYVHIHGPSPADEAPLMLSDEPYDTCLYDSGGFIRRIKDDSIYRTPLGSPAFPS